MTQQQAPPLEVGDRVRTFHADYTGTIVGFQTHPEGWVWADVAGDDGQQFPYPVWLLERIPDSR